MTIQLHRVALLVPFVNFPDTPLAIGSERPFGGEVRVEGRTVIGAGMTMSSEGAQPTIEFLLPTARVSEVKGRAVITASQIDVEEVLS